jgi:hypothetical protein
MKSLIGKNSDPVAERPSSISIVERRSNPRYIFTAAVAAMEPISGARVDAHTMDLSPAGCYIDTMSPFPVGTGLILRLTREGKSYESKAGVVSSQPGVGMGIIFTAARPDQHPTLKQWVAELSGQSPVHEYTLQPDQPAISDHVFKEEQRNVVNELIVALMRKGVLTEEEGESMLSKLLH